MRLAVKLLIFVFAITHAKMTFARNKPYRNTSSSRWCRKVQQIYSQCETQIKMDSKNEFEFTYKNGREFITCDDGHNLPFYTRLKIMDVVSLFMYPYATGQTPRPETRQNWGPCRLRAEPLFKQAFRTSRSVLAMGREKKKSRYGRHR